MHTRVLLPRLAAAIASLGAVVFFVANLARFFPNRVGGVGYDHEMFLPWMLATRYWQATNGVFAPPAFVASFCGGIPLLFNPQSMVFALPQWVSVVLPPVPALLVSWVVFGLGSGIGMYALLRRVFGVSRAAALLGATLFLLNGFYSARMIIGHVTYHGVMLLPALALALFPAGPVARGGLIGRAALVAMMIGYLFYSGATNIILPMALMLVSLGLLLGYLGRWNRQTGVIAALGCGLAFGLCAWKFFPAMAYAAHVTRPVALRMTGSLASLVGGATVSLFVPQVLAWLDPDRFVVDRVELEYGVGLVPLLVLLVAAWVATRRRGPLLAGRRGIAVAAAGLLILPILLNYDGLGLRWLLLHTPVVRSMSVMLRFWSVYIPVLCVATALLLDWLVARADARLWWSAAGIVLTIGQAAATDMGYYATQPHDPAPVSAAFAAVRQGGAVPPVTRIGPPPAPGNRGGRPFTRRDDGLIEGISDVPCYEPMFGYRMNVFVRGRLADGPVLAQAGGRPNLKNPACYVFPGANGCAPGDEFTAAQADAAAAFAAYRPFPYRWPAWQYAAAAASLLSAALCLVGLLVGLAATRRFPSRCSRGTRGGGGRAGR